jgi:hypothetical protein
LAWIGGVQNTNYRGLSGSEWTAAVFLHSRSEGSTAHCLVSLKIACLLPGLVFSTAITIALISTKALLSSLDKFGYNFSQAYIRATVTVGTNFNIFRVNQ